jgi:hypothetical protein
VWEEGVMSQCLVLCEVGFRDQRRVLLLAILRPGIVVACNDGAVLLFKTNMQLDAAVYPRLERQVHEHPWSRHVKSSRQLRACQSHCGVKITENRAPPRRSPTAQPDIAPAQPLAHRIYTAIRLAKTLSISLPQTHNFPRRHDSFTRTLPLIHHVLAR